MKKSILILGLIVAQISYGQAGNENVSFSTGNFFTRANRPTSKENVIDGSAYTTSKDFSKVIIPSYSKNVQDLRYNAYEDEMEFTKDNEVYFANKENGLEITFPDLKKTYVCLTYNLDGNRKQGYLVLLKKGNEYNLYKRERVELLKGEKSPNAYGKDANDYYAKEKDVYMISKGDRYYKLTKKISDMSQIPVANQKALLDFAQKNKINLSKEADMIKLVDYMNNN